MTTSPKTTRKRPPRKPATKAASAQTTPPATTATTTAHPVVRLDNFTRRSDHDVLPGGFCRVETGEHAPEIGHYESTVSVDGDGYPIDVVVQLRASGERITIAHANLVPVPFGGR